jgi:hypothetical protein
LPSIGSESVKPLRLEATLDKEERHPTGVTMGSARVHCSGSLIIKKPLINGI